MRYIPFFLVLNAGPPLPPPWYFNAASRRVDRGHVRNARAAAAPTYAKTVVFAGRRRRIVDQYAIAAGPVNGCSTVFVLSHVQA